MSEHECVGSCGFNVYSSKVDSVLTVGCDSGNGSCWGVNMAAGEISRFHDQELADATMVIKYILERITPRSGHTLSFVHTNMGTLLTWVNHEEVPAGAITSSDDDATIAKALGLILDTPQKSEAY